MTRLTTAAVMLLWTTILAVGWAMPAIAQERASDHEAVHSGVGAVDSILSRFDDEGQLIGLWAVTLIFGAGIIGVSLFGLAALVRAFRGDSLELDELNDRLAAIESKLDSLLPKNPA